MSTLAHQIQSEKRFEQKRLNLDQLEPSSQVRLIKLADEKPCRGCGGLVATIGPGAGPHAGSLRCSDCGRFIQWISKRALNEIGGQS